MAACCPCCSLDETKRKRKTASLLEQSRGVAILNQPTPRTTPCPTLVGAAKADVNHAGGVCELTRRCTAQDMGKKPTLAVPIHHHKVHDHCRVVTSHRPHCFRRTSSALRHATANRRFRRTRRWRTGHASGTRAALPPRVFATLGGGRVSGRRPGDRVGGPREVPQPRTHPAPSYYSRRHLSNRLRVVSVLPAGWPGHAGCVRARQRVDTCGAGGGAWGPEIENIFGVRAAPRLAEGHVSGRPELAKIWWGSMGRAVET